VNGSGLWKIRKTKKNNMRAIKRKRRLYIYIYKPHSYQEFELSSGQSVEERNTRTEKK
jgi:hypothetical protein